MAYRYRQIYPQDGEVLNPQDWNLNQKEIVEEFNGYLDRDNLPVSCVDLAHVTFNTFTKVHGYAESAPWFPATDTVEWQYNDGANDLASISIDCPVDCLLICELGSTWFASSGAVSTDGDIRFRITVDGISVGETHFLSGTWDRWSMHTIGAIPVSAGLHTIRAECQVAEMNVTGTQKYGDTDWVFEIFQRELVVIERRR